MEWDAIVLAGGRAERLGGADKAQVQVGGQTLLARTLTALAGAGRVVVVGPGPVPEGVELVREDPAFSGPAAAIAAALPRVVAEWVVVSACDHPFLADDVPRLLAARADSSVGAVLVAAGGRRQLVFVARSEVLRRCVAEHPDPVGLSIRLLLGSVDLTPVTASERAGADIDTWDDVRRAREFFEGGRMEPIDLSAWIATLATELGTDSMPVEAAGVEAAAVLDLAADAAHAIARPAAPVTTFLAGLAAGLNGGTPEAIADAIEEARAAIDRRS